VVFLDGKPSTPEEAFKAGRAICIAANHTVMFVSTRPGPQVLGAVGAAGNGIYRVELANALQAAMVRNGDPKAESGPQKMSVALLVDCRQGKVMNAAVVVAGLAWSDYVLDPAGLRLQDGRLTGPIALKAVFGEKDRYMTKDRQPVELKYTVDIGADDKGVLSGTFKGTSGGTEVSDKASGAIIAPSAPRDANRFWLQLDAFGAHGHIYAILPSAGGTVQDGPVLFSKGHRIGSAKAGGMTLTDNRLRGKLAVTLKEKPEPQEITIDAAVLGGRLIFGTWTDASATKSMRGGLVPADGPQIEGPTPEQDVQAKAMQKEIEEQQSKAASEKK
jgi:hypothetical protein